MRASQFFFATFGSVLLAGCPFPIPSGYEYDSRENIAEAPPSFVVPGETTREEVLMRLGEPDAIAVDESWIAYGSAYRLGGVGIFVAAGSGAAGVASWGVRYRRLLFQFDPNGIVMKRTFEFDECGVTGVGLGNAGGQSKPCVDIRGNDIPSKFGVREKQSE